MLENYFSEHKNKYILGTFLNAIKSHFRNWFLELSRTFGIVRPLRGWGGLVLNFVLKLFEIKTII